MKSHSEELAGVLVTGEGGTSSLAVVRCFGRRGIPVAYVDPFPRSMVTYSRYVKHRLICPSPYESESEFINTLLEFGRESPGKLMIVPTADDNVLAVAKHKRELEQFYHVPVVEFDTVEKLVNKRRFYKLLVEMQVPHPRTLFPDSLTELRQMGREIAYPYIIKPVYSKAFRRKFGVKCFVVDSEQDLDRAADRLEGTQLEVMIQEIIPGRGTYKVMTYFNRASEPLAICGLDKIRYYPVDFGVGTFCQSMWRSSPVEQGIRFLKDIGYYGFGEPELKKDPRDGEYKFIEINTRVIQQHQLAVSCGVDTAYIAYRDACGEDVSETPAQREGLLWVEDFMDLLSFMIHLKRREIGIGELVKALHPRKVHSVAAWDDPAPFIVYAINSGFNAWRLLLKMLTGRRQ